MHLFFNLPTDSRSKTLILSALLALVVIVLYFPVVHHEFLVVDDSGYVTQNPNVNTGLKPANIAWAFTDFGSFYWHPVTWISHMVDCQLFGLNAGAHHFENVLLHAINAVLLFLLLRAATGAAWRSFLVAMLFAVHPMNVENVAWVAERKSLLSAMFSFATIAAYGWWAQRPALKRYVVMLIAFSLALMSKSMAVTLPIVLLLADYWPLRRKQELPPRHRWRQLFIEKLPLILMSVASSLITFVGQRSVGAVVSFSQLPLYMRIENAITAYVAYLGKLIWPLNLSFFYPHPASKLPQGAHLPVDQLAASLAILAGITAAVIYFRHIRYLFVGWFAFLITMFPVIGIVQAGLQAMADRFAYIPYVGLFIVLVWGIHDLIEVSSSARLRTAATAASAVLVISLGLVARHDLGYWQNGITLLERARTIAGLPDARIEQFLGDAYYFAGQPAQAVSHYATWCQLAPSYDLCHYNLGQVLFQIGDFRAAYREYQLTLSLTRNESIAASSIERSQQALQRLGNF